MTMLLFGVNKIWLKSLLEAEQKLLMVRRPGAENYVFVEL